MVSKNLMAASTKPMILSILASGKKKTSSNPNGKYPIMDDDENTTG